MREKGGGVLHFWKKEPVLCIAAVCALLSIALNPPSAAYLNYIDWRVLSLLFCLMSVVAGLQECGVFAVLAQRLLAGERRMRFVTLVLVLLPFFVSMLVTNDVALITFVPFAVLVLGLIGRTERLIYIVVLQTIAANLGSMATPVGNPQNLYLYANYELTAGQFFAVMLPLSLVSLAGLVIAALCVKPEGIRVVFADRAAIQSRGKLGLMAVLFVLFVLTLTTTSWAEPFIVLIGIGVATVLNGGTNLIFGEISFVTNAAGSVLQLACTLDYSVFLIQRFSECLEENSNPREAMVEALCRSTMSIMSSGLTTVIGFLALVFMRFGLGPDLGTALAKGIAISLVTVFIFAPSLILVTYKLMQKSAHRLFMPSFEGFGRFIYRVMIPMLCVFAVIMVPSFLASNSNSYYYGSAHIYGSDTQYGQDTEAIESVFGKSDTWVAMVPKDDIARQSELSAALHEIPEVTSILSYVDTVGPEIPMEYLDENTLSLLVGENYSRFVITVDSDAEGGAAFAIVERVRGVLENIYPGEYYLAGDGVSTYDLMDTITADTVKVNLIAIGAVFVVLLFSFKSLSLPIILVLSIETAIWINMAIPYFRDTTVFYISYLIVSSIQLGATVDYAILFADRYMEFRRQMPKREAVIKTVSAVTLSVSTSGSAIIVVGLLLGFVSHHGIISQLGFFLGIGGLLSLMIVLFVLPGVLYVCDGLVRRSTLHANFYTPKEVTAHEEK